MKLFLNTFVLKEKSFHSLENNQDYRSLIISCKYAEHLLFISVQLGEIKLTRQ